MSFLSRLTASAAALAIVAGAYCGGPAAAQTAPDRTPVIVGVSGPVTGPYAQYGAQWKRGFDVALDEINASGGINGRPLQYVFEDSQSDPRQSVAIARKFVSDPRIVAELGDFSSAASMAASPIYNAGKLVQFGFTNSHPDFTKGGEYMWSNAPNQSDEMPILADVAIEGLKLRKLAALYLNNDWGRTSKDLLVKAAEQRGAVVVGTEGYLADEKDFRSAIVRLREQQPDGIIMISYYPDGAQITRQLRTAGLTQPIVAMGSVYSPKFIELGGDAVNGVYTNVPFFPGDPRPVVQNFVKTFEAKYAMEPDAYNGRGYDAMILLASVMRQYGATREAVQEGLGKIKGVPSVVYGSVQFNPQTRRVEQPLNNRIVVKDGKFVAWDGQRQPSQ
jgi:branched-chain amino acid transport system substrate-binding protein